MPFQTTPKPNAHYAIRDFLTVLYILNYYLLFTIYHKLFTIYYEL